MARIRFNQRKASARVPLYRRHKPTDQAVVTINGRDIYLGKWNSKTSRAVLIQRVSFDAKQQQWVSWK